MNKVLIFCAFMFLYIASTAQSVYFTRTGHIYFISQTDVIDIDADNNQVASFLDIESGKLQFAVLIKSFEFSLATAKEHFNESYIESDRYPKATFKGEINNIENIDLKEQGTYQVHVTGDITIRGITKTIEVPAEIQVSNNNINARSEFVLAIADFNIKVPKVVEHRVAEQVTVNVNMDYAPYKK
ncbi:MAG: YceI family protein [Bacteroidales bacterium]